MLDETTLTVTITPVKSCYFLLNYARRRGVDTEGAVAGKPCYFLLNYAFADSFKGLAKI